MIVHPFMRLSVYRLFIRKSSVRPSALPNVFPCEWLFVRSFDSLPSIGPSVRPSIRRVRSSVHSSVHPSVRPTDRQSYDPIPRSKWSPLR